MFNVEMLRDPAWQFVAVVLAVIAILISIAVYRKQRLRKSLSYQILSSTALLSAEEDVGERIQILYEGNPIEQVHLLVVRFVNSGNTPLLMTDFVRPLSLSFGEKAQVLSAEVTATVPQTLDASATIEEENVRIGPTLMNQGDSVELKVLVSDLERMNVDGRIVGVKEIGKTMETHLTQFLTMMVVSILVWFGTFGMILDSLAGNPASLYYVISCVLGWISTGLLFIFIPETTFRRWFFSKRKKKTVSSED